MRESKGHKRSPLLIKLHFFYKWGFHYIASTTGPVICLVLVSFCTPSAEEKIPPADNLFRYELDKPDARYKLPGYLEEISGLSYYGKGNIACVQDEKALIYIWNLEKEKIVEKYGRKDQRRTGVSDLVSSLRTWGNPIVDVTRWSRCGP